MRVWDVGPEHPHQAQRQGRLFQAPETRRWVGKLAALHARHEALVEEMTRRGYNHESDLDASLAEGTSTVQNTYIDMPEEQIRLLRGKGCACEVHI